MYHMKQYQLKYRKVNIVTPTRRHLQKRIFFKYALKGIREAGVLENPRVNSRQSNTVTIVNGKGLFRFHKVLVKGFRTQALHGNWEMRLLTIYRLPQ